MSLIRLKQTNLCLDLFNEKLSNNFKKAVKAKKVGNLLKKSKNSTVQYLHESHALHVCS